MTGANKKRKPPAQKASAMQSYMRVTIFLSVALIALMFAQFNISQKQKNMLIITYITERQMALQNNILEAVADFQKKEDRDLIQNIRDYATENQSLEAQVFPLMAQTTWFAMPKINLAWFEKFKNVTIQGISFAAYADARQTGNATDLAQDIRDMHAAGVLENWSGEVRKYINEVQKEVDGLVYGTYALYALVLGFLLFQALTQVLPLMKETDDLRTQMKEMAATDMLTGIYNRAMLFKLGAMLISASQRHKQELTILAVDVDGFEELNNKHGRAAGDDMLRLLVDELATCLRNSDVLGRFGGDEFAIFLPSTDEYRAVYVAEKLRAAAEAMAYVRDDQQIMLTVSIGIAEIQKTHTTPDDMLRAAQAALLKAKNDGRNRCVTYKEVVNAVPAAAV
jgi:diguanylate cyclase (GGDEF)-like protein